MQVEVPRKASIGKAKDGSDEKVARVERNRTRSGSTAEYAQGKKKPSAMQKTFLEDAYVALLTHP